MQDAVDIVLDYAQRAGASQVLAVRMRVGDDAGVVPEALAFAFDVVTENTIAAGARLRIERVPVRCLCVACRREFEPPSLVYSCPDCGKPATEMLSGRECEVGSIEVN